MDIEDLLLRSLKGTTERRPLAYIYIKSLDIVMTSVIQLYDLRYFILILIFFHVFIYTSGSQNAPNCFIGSFYKSTKICKIQEKSVLSG